MYHSYSQLPVSSFSAQQLITMGHAIQAESDAKAMAEAQARAQAQAHAEVMFPTQVQAGGHSTVMTQAKRKTNAMLTGKARKKATKFHTLMSKTKNGAPMQLKKATRPLNAYIAFRSFYSKIFKGYQQKNISGLLSKLWKADPFQAKWAILAKAFSDIRDMKGKTDAALPEFLEINSTFIKVISAEDYLATLGWQLVGDAEGNLNLLREAGFQTASLGSDMLTTNLSVADVVENSYKHGYFTRNELNDNSRDQGPAMIMASVAQTAAPIAVNGDPASWNETHDNNSSLEQQMHDFDIEHADTSTVATFDLGVADKEQGSSTQVFHDISTVHDSSASQATSDMVDSPEGTPTGIVNGPAPTSNNAAPVDANFDVVSEHVGGFPHNLAFDYNSGDDVPFYNPFYGNLFDPFEISDINNTSMSDWFVEPNEFAS